MVVNNFDNEPIQICLCGHLGCGSDTIEECTLLDETENECGCETCSCSNKEDEWDCQP